MPVLTERTRFTFSPELRYQLALEKVEEAIMALDIARYHLRETDRRFMVPDVEKALELLAAVSGGLEYLIYQTDEVKVGGTA